MTTVFPWRRAFTTKSFVFSLLAIYGLGWVAIWAPWIAPHDPYQMNLEHSLLPPVWVQNRENPGISEYPLGTDRNGRDIFSRIVYGTRTAFVLALTAVPLAALIGTLVGLIAGEAGGKVDSTITLICDIIQSLPGIMFMVITILILRSLLTPTWFHGTLTLVIGFALVAWVSLARLIRINVMMVKSELFIEAAVSLGASRRRIIFKHLLPNVAHVVWVWMINSIPAVILLEALLGYIGVPVTSEFSENNFTIITWGGMFFSGRANLTNNPWMLVIPSILLLLISMSFFLLADFLKSVSRPE